MNFKRALRHLTTGQTVVKRAFPPAVLDHIGQAITQSETTHGGEIVFAVEAALDLSLLLKNQPVRERAIDVFSLLRVWDTQHNNGVLIYLLMADHGVEIVVDRGIHTRIDQTIWKTVCDTMQVAFQTGQFEQGVLDGIQAISHILQQAFPVAVDNSSHSELSDQPVIL